MATSRSIGPSAVAAAASASAAPTSARSETIFEWPPPGSDATSASSSSPLRELTTTDAPFAASDVAIARPMPPVAPVSSARFPAISMR